MESVKGTSACFAPTDSIIAMNDIAMMAHLHLGALLPHSHSRPSHADSARLQARSVVVAERCHLRHASPTAYEAHSPSLTDARLSELRA